MWFIQLLFITIIIQNSDAIIYKLNKTESVLMPPVFHLDPYEQCLYENNATGVYCYFKFDLVTDEPSDLYHMIREYSAYEETHFNHTQLSYGICITKTCKHLHKGNTTGDRKLILEACLNETFWRDYKLKTKINHEFSCTTAHDESRIDTLDRVVALVLLAVIVLNILESLREIYYGTDKCPQGYDFLSCFSISQNWAKLTAPPDGPDPRVSKLRFIQGSKCFIMISVLSAHTLYPFFINSVNPTVSDTYYQNFMLNLLINGPTIMMQTFFGIAGFLLAYNFEIFAEKHRVSLAWIPMAVIHRWLKLFAPYVVKIAFYATWMRHWGTGPLWQSVVGREVEACRRDWWKNLLFINNYFDDAPPAVACTPISWYLATDFQLHVLGVLILVLTSGLWRKISLGVLILTGLTTTAAHTYYQDLDPTLLMKPEHVRNSFLQVPTLNHVYKRTHTNFAGYFGGVATGLIVFHLSKTGFKLQGYVGHRYLGVLNILAVVFLVWLSSTMYPEGPRPSLLIRTAFAVFSKTAMTTLMSFYLIIMTFLENDKAKEFMTWRGWAVPSRLAFSMYLVHFMVIKLLVGTKTTLLQISGRHCLETLFGTFCCIFAGAFLFHIFFEAPLNKLIKMYVLKTKDDNRSIKENHHSEENSNIVKSTKYVTEAEQEPRIKRD